jgi:hypothetical protein
MVLTLHQSSASVLAWRGSLSFPSRRKGDEVAHHAEMIADECPSALPPSCLVVVIVQITSVVGDQSSQDGLALHKLDVFHFFFQFR